MAGSNSDARQLIAGIPKFCQLLDGRNGVKTCADVIAGMKV